MTLDTQLRHEIATRIRAAVPAVMDILLFGSQARGDAREDSDVDLVLIVPAAGQRKRTTSGRLRPRGWDHPPATN